MYTEEEVVKAVASIKIKPEGFRKFMTTVHQLSPHMMYSSEVYDVLRDKLYQTDVYDDTVSTLLRIYVHLVTNSPERESITVADAYARVYNSTLLLDSAELSTGAIQSYIDTVPVLVAMDPLYDVLVLLSLHTSPTMVNSSIK